LFGRCVTPVAIIFEGSPYAGIASWLRHRLAELWWRLASRYRKKIRTILEAALPEKDRVTATEITCEQNDTVSPKVAEFVQQSST
jgi:lauroyl/myristoyl acyltransferase